MTTDVRSTGSVKWFNKTKGYGFIIPDNGGSDVFVHISDVRAAELELNDGDKIAYDLETAQGRTKAINLSVAA